MQLNIGTSMRAELSQVISPRMIQSMEILQLPVMALQERIEHELQENPVLEQREPGSDEEGYPNTPELAEGVETPEPVETPPEARAETPETELIIDAKSGEQDFERMEALNEDWSDYFNEESRPSANRISEEMDKKHDAMANMADRPQSLQDFLNDQLPYLGLGDLDKDLVRHMISHLDERGYLTTPLEDIRQSFGQDVTLEQVEDALDELQHLDPPGVGARDYKECLLLQVKTDTPCREVVRSLILNHLEDIQHNRLPVIQKRTGYDIKTIHEGIEVLKHLDPKPGARFETNSTQYVVPDIIIERERAGRIRHPPGR